MFPTVGIIWMKMKTQPYFKQKLFRYILPKLSRDMLKSSINVSAKYKKSVSMIIKAEHEISWETIYFPWLQTVISLSNLFVRYIFLFSVCFGIQVFLADSNLDSIFMKHHLNFSWCSAVFHRFSCS